MNETGTGILSIAKQLIKLLKTIEGYLASTFNKQF
jgi:hypothetical protein